MGPKKEKKKKKTKAELEAERIQNEQNERLALEAEVKRLEEDRIKSEEAAKAKKEAQIQYRIDELRALNDELEEYAPIVLERAQSLEAIEKVVAARVQWSKYVDCNPRPDAGDEAELHTYLSLLADEKPHLLPDALASCDYTESIANDLVSVMANADARGESAAAQHCGGFLQKLRDASVQKLDLATAHILQHADEFVHEEKKEVLVTDESGAGVRVGVWVNLVMKGFRGPMKPLPFPEVGLHVDIPKGLALQRIGTRILFLPYEHISFSYQKEDDKDGDEAPAETETVLGGTIYLEIVALPPPAKSVKPQWVMRPVNDLSDSVETLSYPLGEKEGHNAASAVVPPPLRCSFRVPDGVVVPAESPRVAWWDERKRCWSDDPVSEVEYTADTRTVRFHTIRVGAFALVQKRVADLPYQSWKLEPALPDGELPSELEEPCVALTLNTSRMAVVIEVHGTECRLLQPKLPELAELMAKRLRPGPLVAALKAAGINLMPRDTDAAPAGSTLKVSALEGKLCEEVASVAASFDFASSAYSRELGEARCAFQLRETSVYVGGNIETLDHSMVAVEMDGVSKSSLDAPGVGSLPDPAIKCSLVQAKEPAGPDYKGGAPFDDAPLPGQTAKVYLKNCVKTIASEETIARVERAPLEFQQTVQQLLHLTRPFSFC